jgi:hypothetical protein
MLAVQSSRATPPPHLRYRHQADTLSMRLAPPWSVSLLNFGRGILVLAAAFGLVATLVRVRHGA